MALLSVAGALLGARSARSAWRHAGLRRVVVEGTSMAPTLQPGDRLVLRRPDGLRNGDIVAVPDPRYPTRTLVKRVCAVRIDGIEVRGDNPEASTDSRSFGPVPGATVVGRAVYRYAPPGRAGPLAPWFRTGPPR